MSQPREPTLGKGHEVVTSIITYSNENIIELPTLNCARLILVSKRGLPASCVASRSLCTLMLCCCNRLRDLLKTSSIY
jgi:hypothetical protein